MSQLKDPGVHVVITTVQEPTPAVRSFARWCERFGAQLIIIGDDKGPSSYDLPGAHFFPLVKQMDLPWELARELPVGHYSRKNIGYLIAMQRGSSALFETDDDNRPLPNWSPRERDCDAVSSAPEGWVNVYDAFTDIRIWPRGFPHEELAKEAPRGGVTSELTRIMAPIQQSLANGSPDVDAVWRLLFDQEVTFENHSSVCLGPGAWCPFNSQATWWFPEAFPLLYLPSFCSFRMTDIWRSLIAQRCLWGSGHHVVFHAPDVVQERNEHDLMADFAQEIDGFLKNRAIADTLGGVSLTPSLGAAPENMRTCYEALISKGVFPEEERGLLGSWLLACEECGVC